jgi:serine/threonine-protein kinase CTR1
LPSQTKTFLDQKNQFLHIPYKDLHIEENPIGSGGFADVYKGTWLTQHDQIAIKVLRINHLFDDFYQEISIPYQIHYEHVVTFLGACIEPNFYAIIFEYMPLGSLYDVLHGKNEIITLSWSDRYSLTWQMAKSINYLHNLNPYIIHRDIKSMNFLLKQNGSYQDRFLLKVCDFGLAEIRRESLLQSISCQAVGSLAWKAPELLTSNGKNTKQSDVYSLGMTMWELATGKKPWNEHLDETVIAVLVKIEERPEIPADVPDEYKQAIEDAWNQNPQKRPSCFDLMERMSKQMRKIKEKDELITLAVDLHGQQTTRTTKECILPINTE